jgi:hypothetical protein
MTIPQLAPTPSPRSQAHRPRTTGATRLASWLLVATLTVFVTAEGLVEARVLEQKDLEIIAQIKASATSLKSLMIDMGQSLTRLDLSSAESECLKSALGDLQQISQELASYEYLLTIETEIPDFDDDNAMKEILRFAVDNAISILDSEHKRLNQLLDNCSRFPLSVGKTQQAVQFIDRITTILKSVRPRLS